MSTVRRVSRPAFLTRAVDFLFGFDYFISYAWTDGRTYAVILRDELTKSGFRSFLDTEEFNAGDHWRIEAGRALRKSTRLVAVATPGAVASKAVCDECRTFAPTARRILPIVFPPRTEWGKSATTELTAIIGDDVLVLKEDPSTLGSGPSEEVLRKLREGFDRMRQGQKRTRAIGSVAALLLVLLIVSVLFGLVARRENVRAQEALGRAQRSLAVATATESSRLHAERRWLTASALLSNSRDLPSVFETTYATLANRAPRVRFSSEFDLSVANTEWLRISPSGQTIVAGTSDGRMAVVIGGQRVVTMPERTDAHPSAVAFAPQGDSVWIAAADAGVFELAHDATVFRKLSCALRRPTHISIDPLDGTLVLGQAGDGIYRGSSTRPDALLTSVTKLPLNEFTFSARGDVMAATDYRMTLRIWSGTGRAKTEKLDLNSALDPSDGPVSLPHAPVVLDRSGMRAAVAIDLRDGAKVLIIDVTKRRVAFRNRFPKMHVTSLPPLAFTPDGEELIVTHEQGVSGVSTASGQVSWTVSAPDGVSAFAVDPKGKFIAAAFHSGSVSLIEPKRGEVIERIDAHRENVGALTFDASGATLVSASSGGVLRRWAITDGASPRYLFGERQYVQVAAFGPRDRAAFAFPYNAAVWIILDGSTRKREIPPIVAAVPGRVDALAYNESGSRLLAGVATGALFLISPSSEKPQEVWNHAARIFGVVPRARSDDFFSVSDKEVVLVKTAGKSLSIGRVAPRWGVRELPLNSDPEGVTLLITNSDGPRLMRCDISHGWIEGPRLPLDDEPVFLIQKSGSTIIVSHTSIAVWRYGGGLETIARLQRPLQGRTAGAVLHDPDALLRVADERTELQLELIDLATGRQELLPNPAYDELSKDSWNAIRFLGPNGNTSVVSIASSGILQTWGYLLDVPQRRLYSATGLTITGTTAFAASAPIRRTSPQ